MPPLTFLNSIFLAGLAAAVLPILIHLFSKRRAREARFPSLEFLQELSRKKVRRLQLRQFLLLALRVLIIGFFALAMGRPALQTTGGGLGRGSSTTAIVLDNSLSMGVHDPSRGDDLPVAGTTAEPSSSRAEEGSVFAVAKRRAIEVVGMMREGDRGILALAAAPVRFPYTTSVSDLGLLRQEIERSTIEATRADLPQAVERSLGLLASSKTINRELYVISDFQRGDIEAWQARVARGGDSVTVHLPEALGNAIPEGIRVYLIPSRLLPVRNMAVERMRLDQAGAGPEAGARLVVTVANYSTDEARDLIVRAFSASQEVDPLGEAYLTVPPMGHSDVPVLLRHMPASGALAVSLTPDPLPLDNQAYLVTEQPGVRKVLLISGGSDPAADEGTRYASLALDPEGTHEFFNVETISADDPKLSSGIRADAVVLLDVGRFPDALLSQLERYRAGGGGILIVLGERTDPRMYNTAVFPKLADLELLGLQGDPAKPEMYRSLRITMGGHPIFEGFPSGAGGNLTAARFQRVLEARIGSGARTLAEFSGGMPALVEDRGTLVFASSFDGRWNDLPTSGAYLPLLHRMMQYLIARGGGQGDLYVGSRLETVLEPDQIGGQEAYFLDPAGTKLTAERSEREGKVWLTSPPTRRPGIHPLLRGDGTRLGLYAVNIDTRESDLRVAPEAWLPALFNPPAKLLKPDGQITRTLVEGRYGRELWPILLTIVLVLMVAESLIGRGKVLP